MDMIEFANNREAFEVANSTMSKWLGVTMLSALLALIVLLCSFPLMPKRRRILFLSIAGILFVGFATTAVIAHNTAESAFDAKNAIGHKNAEPAIQALHERYEVTRVNVEDATAFLLSQETTVTVYTPDSSIIRALLAVDPDGSVSLYSTDEKTQAKLVKLKK